MRIHLAVDDDVFPPDTGGRQRTFGLARGLAREHDVRLLCVVPNRSRGAARERADGVTIVRRRAWHTSLAWRLDRSGVAPMFVTAWGHAANAARDAAALGGSADVLACDLHLAGLFGRRAGALTVYASQNVESDRFANDAAPLAGRGFWHTRLLALERRVVHEADLTIACSDEDAARLQALHGLGRERVVVIPNGFDERAVRPPTPAERRSARAALDLGERTRALLFVGADWAPNREALGALERELVPALAGEDAVLLVAGAVSGAVRDPRVRRLGHVADLLPVLHAADLGLNPVQSGGGSNVKLPLYLAAGLGVVTTPFGLRGYAPLTGLVTVRPLEGFADAVREAPAGGARPGGPRPAAIEDYAWGALGERLGAQLAARVAARTRGAA